MALASRTVTAAATATLVDLREGTAAGVAAERGGRPPADFNGMGMELTVPAGGQTVYVGGPDVTATGATTGRAVPAGTSFAFDLDPREQVYVIVAAGTQAVSVFATGV
jgi:hypothetical protein